MEWNQITSEKDLEQMLEDSNAQTCLLLKHSGRCSISEMALNRLERNWNNIEGDVKPYFLDILSYRPISNKVAEIFQVRHESPQILLIKHKNCYFNTSHAAISTDAIKSHLEPA